MLPALAGQPDGLGGRLANLASNLQLVADMGYGDVALVVEDECGLRVVADARPMTAISALAASRVGETVGPDSEPQVHEALASGETVRGLQRRGARGIAYATTAYPLALDGSVRGALVRNVAQQVTDSPGKMETEFMRLAEEVIALLCEGPIHLRDGSPFATTRSAGDGVLRVAADGSIAYASPNAVNIMRLAGAESLVGTKAPELPGGGQAVAPVVGSPGEALGCELEVADRSLRYRSIGLRDGAFVLVEDTTESRRREQELKVKDATIREVHHRVKNNLQTVASLLRIQARRAETEGERRSLREAVERVASMAVVHEMLAAADDESVDFGVAGRRVVEQVRRGLAGEDPSVTVLVEGETGPVSARVATSLALVLAELVHNAIEHGAGGRRAGLVSVSLRRHPEGLTLSIRDDGAGLPDGFDPVRSGGLGLAIVRTLVQDDLGGTIAFRSAHGAVVTVRVPFGPDGEDE